MHCTLPGQPICASRKNPLWSTTACIIIALAVIVIGSTLAGTDNMYMHPINSPGHLRESPACSKHRHNVPKPFTHRKRHTMEKVWVSDRNNDIHNVMNIIIQKLLQCGVKLSFQPDIACHLRLSCFESGFLQFCSSLIINGLPEYH